MVDQSDIAELFDAECSPYLKHDYSLYAAMPGPIDPDLLQRADTDFLRRRKDYNWRRLIKADKALVTRWQEDFDWPQFAFDRCAKKPLCFYGEASCWLYHLVCDMGEQTQTHRVVAQRGKLAPPPTVLTGKSVPIHALNQTLELRLSQEDMVGAAEYLSFFCHHLSGDDGLFFIIEEQSAITGSAQFPKSLNPAGRDARVGRDALRKVLSAAPEDLSILANGRFPRVETVGHPLIPFGISEKGALIFQATVVYGSDVFRALFGISHDGLVEMMNDENLDDLALAGFAPPWSIADKPLKRPPEKRKQTSRKDKKSQGNE